MRDIDREHLEERLPDIDLKRAIDVGLEALFNDEEHATYHKVAGNWSYEELISVLLLARDLAEDAAEKEAG